jgi:hypothetical protein
MHRSLLSQNERKLIKRYLETGEKLEGFKVLLHRARKETIQETIIEEDLKLIKELLAKAGEKPS